MVETDNVSKNSTVDTNKTNSIQNDFSDEKWKFEDIIWIRVLFFVYFHIGSAYGIYLVFTGQCKIATMLMTAVLIHCLTAGAHRLWSHKAYKAKWPLKLILTVFNTIGHQNGIWKWVINHRVHHKCQEIHADPHNASRGLFFSHGWLLLNERPTVDEHRRTIDMSDCIADPFVMFQKKYYWPVMISTWFAYHFFGKTLNAAWHIGVVFRRLYIMHAIFLINSFAHYSGMKPYDKNIRTTDHPIVSVFTGGEGWHNYHHVFSRDYKAAELGNYSLNISTAFIDFFAKIGWAYDLKTVSDEMILKRMAQSGDGCTKYSIAKPGNLQAGATKSHMKS